MRAAQRILDRLGRPGKPRLNEMIAMRDRGHEMAVVSRPGARIIERAKEAGFAAYAVDMRGAPDLPAIVKLRRLMREFRADIVNTHSGRDTRLDGMAARSMGKTRPRLVRTRHLVLPITSRFIDRTLPDKVVEVSSFVRDYLVSAGIPDGQVEAVPTGIDLNRYTPADGGGTLRSELGLPDATVLVGTVATLRVKKGYADLLRAAGTVLQSFPDTHFVIAGDGPQTENLRRLIVELGLQARVHMPGLRRDMMNVFQSLDRFVLPTYQEALGTVFIETDAMGLPVAATDVDGVPEVVVDGETGVLVPPRDPAALAVAISGFVENPLRRRDFGDNARRLVGSEFSREALAGAGCRQRHPALVGGRASAGFQGLRVSLAHAYPYPLGQDVGGPRGETGGAGQRPAAVAKTSAGAAGRAQSSSLLAPGLP
jgi:glycosyltransferase involved in cell wall biosynthesis